MFKRFIFISTTILFAGFLFSTISIKTPQIVSAQTTSSDWPIAGANVQRTSNSDANVSTVNGITWYRPIEAYIDGATQLITAGDKVYIATAKGLVVLDAENGNVVCRFDTELPVATPTVDNGSVYVPGFDRKLYSLDAATCNVNWTFTGAGAGFSANPLVVGERIYIGNRDGKFYAINTSNGAQAWSFTTDGPVIQSAAYDNNVVYFASMDMYGYALNTSNGLLVWKTPQKLPGEQYSKWWPIVHGNYVVWSAATAYKNDSSPGALDAGPNEVDFNGFFGNVTGTANAGEIISSSDGSHGWPIGSTVVSTTISGGATTTLQGWTDTYPARRVYAIVNKTNGTEPFYLPILESGQNEMGQMHPPVSDGTSLYFNGPYQRGGTNIPRSAVFAWKEGTTWLRRISPTTFAADEPLILSMTNGRLFANLCCDREARTLVPGSPNFWTYGVGTMLDSILPSQGEPNSYDPMWTFYDGEQFLERLGGYYKGNSNSRNGVYNHHGMQNPLVPLVFTNSSSQRVERLFTHRSNAIIAIGPNSNKTPLPLVTINPNPNNPADTLSTTELQSRLETEVQKMVSFYQANGTNGFLRPAYINSGGVSNTTVMPESSDYFKTPADTLYTLSIAYPYLSSSLKTSLLSYLNAYWQKYFVTSQVRSIGWNSGTQREAFTIPPEVANRMSQIGDLTGGSVPQRSFYAAAKYAELVPSQAASIYATMRPLLVYPPPGTLDIVRGPGIYNDYIAGYQGFIDLYDLAGTNPDPALRTNVANQLTTLTNTRTTNFTKDHPWEGSVDNPTGITINNYVRMFNCSRNFLYMTPVLGTVMRTSSQSSTIMTALNEYQYVCPHWFMARNSNSFQESSAHHIFDTHALFLAKAYVGQESQANLSKWIDVPWMLGDLYYIQNVVATLQASGAGPTTPPSSPTPTPVPGDVNGDGSVNLTDLSTLLANFGGTGKTRLQGDVSGNDGVVGLTDLSTLLANFGRN